MRESFVCDDDNKEELQQSIVFAGDGSGNPILINSKGEVVLFDHDNGEREVLAKSLGDFIEENFEEW